jgi:serine/threonine-protein kinase RsbW
MARQSKGANAANRKEGGGNSPHPLRRVVPLPPFFMECVEVHIPSNLIFERVVRASADEIAQTLDFSEERINDLKLAVSEAVTNAIEHGNEKISSKLVAVAFVLDNQKLEIRIADQGAGTGHVDPSPRVVDEHNLDEGMLRGFGMYLIGALVDDWEVISSDDGTVITLRFYLEGRKAKELEGQAE